MFLVPVQIFLLIQQICLGDIIRSGIGGKRRHDLIQGLNAFLLKLEVCFEIGLGIFDKGRLVGDLHLGNNAQIQQAVGVFLNPSQFLGIVIEVL